MRYLSRQTISLVIYCIQKPVTFAYNNANYGRDTLAFAIFLYICIQRRFFSVFFFMIFTFPYCFVIYYIKCRSVLGNVLLYKERNFVSSSQPHNLHSVKPASAAILCKSIILRYHKTAHRQHTNSNNVKRSGLCCNYQY